MNKLITILIIILIGGCKNKEVHENVVTVNIDLEKVDKESMEDWFDCIELIPLELTENSLIKEVFKMTKFNNSYYLYDGWQHVGFEFDSIGNFVNTTNILRGNGPDEFVSFLDFDIDQTNGNWHILDHVSKKIRMYNKKLLPIGSYDIDENIFPAQYFKLLKDGIYVFYTSSANKGDYILKFYDSANEKIIKKQLPVVFEQAEYLPNVIFSPFYEFDGKLFFTEKYPNNDVYNIDLINISAEKCLQYDFKEHTFNLEDLENVNSDNGNEYIKYMDTSNKGFIFNKCENEQNYFISVYYNHYIYIIKHDKITGENKAMLNDYSKQGSLGRPIYLDDDYYYSVVDTENIKLLVDYNLLTDNARGVLLKIKDDDNPIIIKYKLKKR